MTKQELETAFEIKLTDEQFEAYESLLKKNEVAKENLKREQKQPVVTVEQVRYGFSAPVTVTKFGGFRI